MCTTNFWKRIEAVPISSNPFRFELRGMRSDGVLFKKQINVHQSDRDGGIRTLPGIVEKVIEGINEFEKLRNLKMVEGDS